MNFKALLTLFLFLPIFLFAQSKVEFGIGLGASNHLSDTQSESLYLAGTAFAYDIHVRYPINPSFALKVNYFNTRLSGDEKRFDIPWRKARGFQYNDKLQEIGLGFEWDILGKMYSHRQDSTFHRRLSPYIFAGTAVNIIGFKVDYNVKDGLNPVTSIDLINKDISDRKTISLAVPVGGGLRFDLTPKICLNIEASLRKTNSDYLDGISFAGNPLKKDWYCSALVGLNYSLLAPDSDHDGVPNRKDMCPNEAGSRSAKGCPDKDEDGIADKDDRCPSEYGLENLAGCADQDDDGIADEDDICPDTPGEKTLGGCPDSDKDGVVDALDKCPDVPGKAKGCPDGDKDGVADKDDFCPEVYGKVMGCPDSDKDGVADKDDRCPDVFGVKANSGCPNVDADGDGVVDRNDKCPNEKGLKEYGGCPAPDEDKDGVADKEDKCPNVFGLASFGGCPDSDGDGVEDSKDLCPKLFGTENKGCPNATEIAALRAKTKPLTEANTTDPVVVKAEPKKETLSKPIVTTTKTVAEKVADIKKIETPAQGVYEEVSLAINLSAKKIKFATNSDILTKTSLPELNRVARIMKTYSNYNLNIEGHTDNVGNDEKNTSLSERRAKRCYEYLISKGIVKSRLSYEGFGAKRPIASNNTVEGRFENRRVELKIR